jgi:hypothetical protein
MPHERLNTRVDEFEKLEIVSVAYDEQEPDRYDCGIYLGIIVKKLVSRLDGTPFRIP